MKIRKINLYGELLEFNKSSKIWEKIYTSWSWSDIHPDYLVESKNNWNKYQSQLDSDKTEQMKDIKFGDDVISSLPEDVEVGVQNYNSTEELKKVLHVIEDNENFIVMSSEKNDDFTFLKKDDSGNHNNDWFDNYSEDGNDVNPYTMASMDYTTYDLTAYIEIKKPFTRYENDEYGATEYIEFENGDVYRIMFDTPSEQQAYDKISDGLEDMSNKCVFDSFESVNKIVDELIV